MNFGTVLAPRKYRAPMNAKTRPTDIPISIRDKVPVEATDLAVLPALRLITMSSIIATPRIKVNDWSLYQIFISSSTRIDNHCTCY